MKIFKGLIIPIIVVVLLLFNLVQCIRQMAESSQEDLYIVAVSENCGTLNINLIEPSVRTVTQQMVLRYYADSLGFEDKDLYFMEVPEDVHKAIEDSTVNVLRFPKDYMRRVKFYSLARDSI